MAHTHTIFGSERKQEILALYREGKMSLEDAAREVCEIDHPRRPLWEIVLIFIVAAISPILIDEIDLFRR